MKHWKGENGTEEYNISIRNSIVYHVCRIYYKKLMQKDGNMYDKIKILGKRLSDVLKGNIIIHEYYDDLIEENYWEFKIKFFHNNMLVRVSIYEKTINYYNTDELFDIIITYIKTDILTHFIK